MISLGRLVFKLHSRIPVNFVTGFVVYLFWKFNFVHILILWLFLIPIYEYMLLFFLGIKIDWLCCSPAKKMCTFTYGEDWILQSHKKQIPQDARD